ncbi:YiiD C-terminal domain-containing protein [Thermomonas flagellata]|uniref:YiiD C-terminal domain-containing protein n=1 Tax=Thermomonas flagellata TaxID=2888524 RepID=UPI001F04A89A|nr:YiiD C-terminal domain-containing protein [Thermomonas flagellata]
MPTVSAADLLASHFDAMPPVRALQPRVLGWADGRLRLGAPLAANVNDKGCAFGGSLVSLMTIAGWGVLALRLAEAGVEADLYVADSRVRYLKPVYEDLQVEAAAEDPAAAAALAAQVRAHGRAGLRVRAQVRLADGAVAAVLDARYVAIARG